MASDGSVVHYHFDTLPRLVPSAPSIPSEWELVVPFRIDLGAAGGAEAELRLISWRLHAEVDDTPWATRTRRVTAGYISGLRRQSQRDGMFDFERLPPYLGMEAGIAAGAEYVEGRVLRLAAGSHVRYWLEVTLQRGEDGEPIVQQSREYSLYAVRPVFVRDDIRRIFLADVNQPLDAWVLYHQRSGGFDHVRIDVVDLEAQRPARGLLDLVVTLGKTTVNLGSADLVELPFVDPSADSVVISVPADGEQPPTVDVCLHQKNREHIDLNVRERVGQARVVFVNFAIQGLNDYFAPGDAAYSSPRTYTQVTMRDELATFCSKPGTVENNIGDGYEFTLEAHRRYNIKQMWAMNGGLLDLLAHDCPGDLEGLRTDVANGLVVPVVAGFGAHRLPYYSAATNTDAITFGMAAMDGILGGHSAVYYPDSRIYTNTENVTDALRAAKVEYLVLDADRQQQNGVHNTIVRNANPPLDRLHDARWVDYQYLWRDASTGIKILFIDPEMKDGLFQATEADADQGKVSVDIRRKFIEMAALREVRDRNLLVYSDDADKASGDGWFDGDGLPLNKHYQATLSWIRAHPWVQAVTTDDLTDDDCIGEMDVVSASDPYIVANWRLPGVIPDPAHDFGLSFDTWYAQWKAFPAAWLGETLGQITERAEHTIARWPVSNRLVDLARLYFTMCLHESQWSKYSRPNAGKDPEDFVVAESIQLRNAHVYLNAAIWADWATPPRAQVAYRDAGPVIERVAALDRQADQELGAPAWRHADPASAGLQWDHDPLSTIVLYNTQVLVVIDRNGGRITHLFSMVDGRPYSLSGTFKAYQFLDVDWASGTGTECDGIVLQNTVYGPNHAYVACDVEPSRGTLGAAPKGDGVFDWYYPDNFNAYDLVDSGDGPAPWVTLGYAAAADAEHLVTPPETLETLAARLTQDRMAKIAGERGIVVCDPTAFRRFRKTIRLDGRTVHVAYQDTRPGHLVANEFCVDLWSAAIQGRRQTQTVSVDGRTVTVSNGAGPAVDVTLERACAFSPATLAPPEPATLETLRLHRVMTDNVEIVAPGGGDFAYRITST
jgi:hypothetical protein